MKCPLFIKKCPVYRDKTPGRDSRAHKEPGHCPVPVLSRFAPECPGSNVLRFDSRDMREPRAMRDCTRANANRSQGNWRGWQEGPSGKREGHPNAWEQLA